MADVVSGYILAHSFGGKEVDIFEHNSRSISALPENGSFIIRPMFSAIPLEHRGHVNTFQVIHFAGVYDEMYCLDKEWVKEFEVLLSKLSWWSATVFHSYTGMRLEYMSKDHSIGSEAIPTSNWEIKGYESYHYLKEVDPSEVIC